MTAARAARRRLAPSIGQAPCPHAVVACSFLVLLFLAVAAGGCEAPDRPIPVLDGPIVRSSTEEGALRVDGTVTNLGTLPADFLKVVVRVEDPDENEIARTTEPIAASSGPESSQSTLYPYESAPFTLVLDVDAARAGKIAIRFEYQTPAQ